MANEIIDIRENEMSEVKSQLNKTFSKMDKILQRINTSFSNVTKTGLLNNSTKIIGNQMRTIARQIDKTSESVTKTYENMYFVEKVLKQKAEEIPTPTDFCVNDTASEVSITVGNLEKKDGKSLSKDKTTDEKELDFKGSIEYNQKIKSIVKEHEATFGEIEINVDRIELNNISKENVTIEKQEEDSEIARKEINNINKNNIENKVEYDDKTKVEKINVETINNNNQKKLVPEEVADKVLDNIQEKIDDNIDLENQNE